MRKNRMMRAASALSIAVLLSTCTISGTFAKYVTTGSGSDKATVAQWGVQISGMDSELFKNSYAKSDTSTIIANTVSASDKLVAPGTANAEGVKFSLTGTPEVAVRVAFAITKSDNVTQDPIDVVLPAGEYTDWTTAPYNTKFTAEEYHPIKFTLKDGSTSIKEGTLAEIKEYLEGSTVSKDYGPGTDLSTILGGTTGEYTLTWDWTFEQGKNQEDTLLGNIVAGKETGVANASTDIDFAISITATQID